jgi:hypothetical protein
MKTIIAFSVMLTSISSFAESIKCVGMFDGIATTVTITPKKEENMVRVNMKNDDGVCRGDGILNNTKSGYMVTSIVKSDEQSFLVTISISKDFLSNYAVVKAGEISIKSKLTCNFQGLDIDNI